MPQPWARFPCPQCGKIAQENWGPKCRYCGADLTAEREKLAAQRQAAKFSEAAVPSPPVEEGQGEVPEAVKVEEKKPEPVLPSLLTEIPIIPPEPAPPQPVESEPEPIPPSIPICGTSC